MILIYCKEQTERLTYIIQHIFNRILGVPFQFCMDMITFEKYEGCKINYSDIYIEDVLSIVPHTLLFERNIIRQEVDVSIYKGMPVCFQTKQMDEKLPFDVFAACFFFLSRYEEYLPHRQDAYQRYDETESIAYRNSFLNLAIVDRWIEELANVIKNKYPDIVFLEKECAFIPTYDIDIAYAYRNKGFLLNAAGYIRSLLEFDFKAIGRRTKVLLGKSKDPYDTFDYLSDLHDLHNLKPCYFFLVAQNRSPYDKNTNTDNKCFKKLIQCLATNADIGLHASYYVKDHPQKIDFEIDYLKAILHRTITKNRHHYLRFSLPDSYRLLESKGIKEEYSMGYVRTAGFRAGTCNPFLFFDLQNDRISNMEVYPLLFMESAFSNIQDPDEIIRHLTPYIEEIKRYRGVLVSLFHNQSFGQEADKGKWRKVYEGLLELVVSEFKIQDSGTTEQTK